MAPRWHRLPRILIVFVVAGWVFGTITALDGDATGIDALFNPQAIQSAMAALLVGLLWGWTLLLLPARLWYLGGLVAAPAALAALPLYFTIWPVQDWEITALNASGVVLQSYYKFLTPITLVMGATAAWWGHQPDPPAPTFLDDDPAPEKD